jgi:lipopolysaccharide export system protein LptA
MARGRAESIEYDLVKRTVRLSDDAWLSDGSNEIRGQQLVYDLREQRVEAGSRAGRQDRVQITIRPGATPPSPAPAPAPPGTTTAPAPTPAPAPQP